MSCSQVKPIPPCTWTADAPTRGSSSAANASAIVAARWRSTRRRGVDRPTGVVAGGARELHGAQHVGAQVLHRLEGADRRVELAPLLRVVDRDLERAGRGADALDHCGDSEPVDGLGDGERRVADPRADGRARRRA